MTGFYTHAPPIGLVGLSNDSYASYGDTFEGFWSHIKRSILGTHIHVSRKHMEKYLGEFEYRYNMRDKPEIMFNDLLLSF